MGRIFKLEYKSTQAKNTRMFFIQKFTIDDICEIHGEYWVSCGYINFKDNIKKIKRKYNYNKKYDSFYCYEIVGGVKKILKSVSSTEDKIIGIPSTFNPGYEGIKSPNTSLKNRFMIKDGYLSIQETNFATENCMKCLDSLIEEGANKMKDTNNNTFLHEFYEGLSPEMKQIFKALTIHESGHTTFRKEESIMYEIKNVYINETKGVTTIVFGNGDKIKVVKDSEDKNDIEKAIAIAIIKYYFGLDYYFDACKKVVNAEKKAKPEKKKKPKPTIKPRSKKQQIDPEKEVK